MSNGVDSPYTDVFFSATPLGRILVFGMATAPHSASAPAIVAAALAVSVCVWLSTNSSARRGGPNGSAVPSAPAPAPRPDWIRVVPPSITLYSAGLSDTVGGPFGSFADAFTDAMAPWQAGNYVEAAMRLDVLAASFPAVAEAHFYQGAAWLLAGVPADAVAPLRRSVALAPAAMHPDATWYLGLALVEADEVADGMQVFIAGCAAGGRSACRAVEYLRGVQPMPVVLAPPVSWPAHSAREYDGA